MIFRPDTLRRLERHQQRVLDRLRADGQLDGAVRTSEAHLLGPAVRGLVQAGRLQLVRVVRDGGAGGTATTPASWTYSLYQYFESDAQPSPLPTPLATGRAPRMRTTVDDVGAWVQAPDWSVAIAELRAGLSGDERWRLLVVDERLPIVVCDPGGG